MLLPFVSVGLEEGDLVAARGQRPDDPAVIGRGAVPVGRNQARAVEGDIQSGASAWPPATAGFGLFQAAADIQQLIDAMGAGVPGLDGCEPRTGQRRRDRSDR